MQSRARAWAALLSLLLPATAVRAQARDFVRVRAGGFVVGERSYHFVGVNYWYGMNLGAEGPTGDRARLVRELDALQRLGITNLRLTAASEGPVTEPQRVRPVTQPAAGEYDESVLRGLDFLLAEMSKRGMRGVLILNNFFQWTGGMAQYVSWATGEPIPYPERDGHSWDEFQNYSSRFYTLPAAQRLFEKYVAMVVNRHNHVTGVRYSDDPTIMAWQLSNEPRGRVNSDAYVSWVDQAGAFLKKEAPHQLVSLGGEGKLVLADSTQFARVSGSRYLDYLTIHLWIENWGWFDPTRPEATFNRSVGRSMGYLSDHVAIAEALHKPLVLEEFGVARDGRGFDPGSGVSYRDRFFESVLEAVDYLAREGSVVAGANVWSWSGEGRPVRPGAKWNPGEPFTGDPAHERQGWYSIYDGDTSTVAIVGRYARRLAEIGRPGRGAGGGN